MMESRCSFNSFSGIIEKNHELVVVIKVVLEITITNIVLSGQPLFVVQTDAIYSL